MRRCEGIEGAEYRGPGALVPFVPHGRRQRQALVIGDEPPESQYLVRRAGALGEGAELPGDRLRREQRRPRAPQEIGAPAAAHRKALRHERLEPIATAEKLDLAQQPIHGHDVRANAQRHTVGGLSAHADQRGLIEWYGGIAGHPPLVLVHGEDKAREALAGEIGERYGVTATLATPGLVVDA